MKTWQIPRFGLEYLEIRDREANAPAPHEVVVKVNAVALNYRDLLVAGGTFLPNLTLPFVPCSDAAGVVASVGSKVTRFRVGDRVTTAYKQRWLDGAPDAEELATSLGGPLPGVLCEEIVLPETGLVATPVHLSDAEAATLPIAGVTAWFALVEDGKLQPGQTVVVQGTGGVSVIAAQMAHALGARVIATSSSDQKLERLRRIVPCEGINYRTSPDWQQRVLELTAGRGADHILEVVGGANLARSVEALAIGGHIALIGFLDNSAASLPIPALMRKRGWIQGAWVGHRRAFEDMNRFLEAKQIHPVIDAIYSFADVPAAFEHLKRGAFGKIVISLS